MVAGYDIGLVEPIGAVFNGGVSNGFNQTTLSNPELRWERTGQFNAGLDMAFLKGRILVTTDYYMQSTTDLLLNKTFIENLQWLDENNKAMELRYPLIPGFNDDEADLLRMLAFLKKLKKRHPLSILPYHKIGSHKYNRFGIEYKMDGVEEPSEQQVKTIEKLFETAGFETKIGG